MALAVRCFWCQGGCLRLGLTPRGGLVTIGGALIPWPLLAPAIKPCPRRHPPPLPA
jgi:hypothetical protein